MDYEAFDGPLCPSDAASDKVLGLPAAGFWLFYAPTVEEVKSEVALPVFLFSSFSSDESSSNADLSTTC